MLFHRIRCILATYITALRVYAGCKNLPYLFRADGSAKEGCMEIWGSVPDWTKKSWLSCINTTNVIQLVSSWIRLIWTISNILVEMAIKLALEHFVLYQCFQNCGESGRNGNRLIPSIAIVGFLFYFYFLDPSWKTVYNYN